MAVLIAFSVSGHAAVQTYSSRATWSAATTAVANVSFEGIVAPNGSQYIPSPPGFSTSGNGPNCSATVPCPVNFDLINHSGSLFIIGDGYYYPATAVISAQGESGSNPQTLQVSFSPASTAVGIDYGQINVEATFTFTLSTGEVFQTTAPPGLEFFGVTTDTPITGVSITMLPSGYALNVSLFSFGSAASVSAPYIGGVQNNSQAAANLSPGVLAFAYGSYLGDAEELGPVTNPEVFVDGVPAAIEHVFVQSGGGSQIQFQIPSQTAVGGASVVVSNDGLTSNTYSVFLYAYSPSIDTNGGVGFHSDGTLVTEASPAAPGEPIDVFVDGLGAVRPPPPPSLSIDGIAVTSTLTNIVYQGGTTGYDLSFIVPSLPSGDYPMILSIAGTSSPAATFPILASLAPLAITTPSLANGTVGSVYSQTVGATGGQAPYSWSATGLPSGLTIQVSSGAISGTPASAGTYSIQVTVTDSLHSSANKTYSVTISPAQAPLQVSPGTLTFAASSPGDSPASQIVTVTSSGTTAVRFTVSLDGGQPNTAPPSWLAVTPLAGTTPGVLTVSVNPSSLSAGSFSGRILVLESGASAPIAISVSLTVGAAGPKLTVSPASLNYAAHLASPGFLDQTIAVSNAGSGTITFSAYAPIPIPWLDSITPGNGQASPGNPVFIRIRVNTNGLTVGGYKGTIQVATQGMAINIPVSLFVSPSGAILGVDQTGLRFDARQGQGLGSVKTVQVLNAGDSGSVNFTAKISNGANWLTISPASGSATIAQPGPIQLSINSNAQSLPPGGYFAIVQVTDTSAASSSQFIVVVLNVSDDNQVVTPDLSPGGLVFAKAGTQTVTMGVSSSSAVSYTASATTNDGGTWLSVSPASGSASSSSSAKLSVATSLTGLMAGVYRGLVNIAIGSQVRSVNVTLIVPPGTGAAAAGQFAETTSSSCSASSLVLTLVEPATNFNVPGGFPDSLSIAMNDNCGNPLSKDSVSADFSNGDRSLSLHYSTAGYFNASWTPHNPTTGMTITAHGSSGTLQSAIKISGGVMPNAVPVPAFTAAGVVNNYYPDSVLSPGLIAQVYGSELASGVGQSSALPLPLGIQGTSVQIGPYAAPLYYVSSGQVNIEIPSELPPGQYPILVTLNNATALDTININGWQAGVAANTDASVVAQHADGSYVTSSHPAKAGEVIVIYLAGLGATNPAVPSGQAAPSSEPLARVVNTATVTVDSQNAPVQFAGLAPGFVGLYQIDLQVPANARSGSLPLVVSQSGVMGNTTNLFVGQ
ncbi:MAG TPA: putative Ig domain-containing protein [Bryobacteraceae bacterium]|nr:putative Ig domain-containing protein [Bryobacteraceae bacterium]